MSLTIQNFDEAGDEVTQRGKEYFIKGAVTSLDDIGHEEWQATVLGTEEYSVEITLKKNAVSSTDCTCFYFANHEYCKHIAAVLYAIRDKKDKPTKGKKTKEPKIKSPLQQLQHSADTMDAQHLRSFIKAHAVHNRDFTNSFLFYARQIVVSADPTLESYRDLIRLAVQSSIQRSRKSTDIDDDKLFSYLKPLVEQARQCIAADNYLDAVTIIKSLIEELETMSESPFTGDKTFKLFMQAFELLQAIATSDVPFTFKDDLFEYTLAKAQSDLFNHSILEKSFHTLLLHLAIDGQKRNELLTLFAKKVKEQRPANPQSHSYSYHAPWLDFLYMQIDLLRLMKRDNEASQILRDNALYNEDVRKKAVEYAIEQKDFTYAKSLIDERLTQMKSNDNLYRYHKRPWEIFQLKIAEAENDKPQIVAIASSLALDTMDMAYYRTAKKQSSAAQWKTELQSFLQKIVSRHLSVEFLGKVYAEENMTEELFQLMQKYKNIYLLFSFAHILIPKHKKEIFALYRSALETFAVEAFTSNYATIRDHLNHLIDLGGLDTARETVAHFKNIYKGRPKLLEQLSKVKIPN